MPSTAHRSLRLPGMSSLFQRVLLLTSALLAITASPVVAYSLEPRQAASNLPAPIAVAPDQNWDGIDGQWSTFTLRVGTPQQFVRTFISFGVYQTWVVLPQGCSTSADPDQCSESRGWLFDNDTSSTFEYLGIYDLWVGRNLGHATNGIFGFDTVGLGGEGEGGPTLKNTTVGAFASTTYYLGFFGINPKPSNFTDFNTQSPSYMTQLKEQRMIPSVSFGYTAGAHYRFTGTFASLTLGGYDVNKYDANNVTFIFAGDNERDLMVSVQSISTPSQMESNPVGTELLPSPIYALIDATVPELWLPLEACQVFEYEFGLVFDNASSLYLINDTHHQDLVDRNASISLVMGQGPNSEETVRITLPYAAFDLSVQPPTPGVQNTSYYFPLRRAANDSQYTLGRTFLQEAYITVDYEVARFQLAQVHWDQTLEQNLVAIPPANASQDDSLWTSPNWGTDSASSQNDNGGSPSSPSGSSLSAGAIAGIVVGAVALLAILAVILLLYRRRRTRKRAAAETTTTPDRPTSSSASSTSQPPAGKTPLVYPKAELAGSAPLPFGMTHHDADRKGLLLPPGSSPTSPGAEGTYSSTSGATLFSPASEADSKQLQIFEMPGDMPVVREKDGKQLSEKEALQHRERLYNGVDAATTPTTPGAGAGEGGDQLGAAAEPRRVNAEDVVDARTGEAVGGGRHRAFSFEGERGTLDGMGGGV